MITNLLLVHPHTMGFIGFNFLAFGMYKATSGPTKNNLRKNFTIAPGSSAISPVTAHLIPTSILEVLSSSALIYTIGNKHIWKYGALHFWKVAVVGAVVGGIFAKLSKESYYSGTLASAAAVTFYNTLKNPAWFYFGTMPTAALLLAYTAANKDRAVGASLAASYSLFLFAL